MDLYSKLTLGFQNKANDKFKVYEALLENLRQNQEEIIKREKKEVRQKKKTNLVEEHKGSSAKEKHKYTHEMFNIDQERREKQRQHQMHYLGNGITQEIIDGKLELKGISKEGIKAGFNDFIGTYIFTLDEELDLDKELESFESSWKINELSNIEQRHKSIFEQPRQKVQLKPLAVKLLPFVTKACKETNKYIIRPKISRVGVGDSYFEFDHMLMKNFPTVAIKGLDAKDSELVDIYIRFTNPNMSLCVITLSKLKESQAKSFETN